jgi:AAA+ ATPase superfamily predicted ATPase
MKTPSTLLGRDKELAQLQTLHASAEAKLVVMYGRRRIGKTFLIRSFIEDKTALYFDGLEDGSTEDQLEHVAKQLFAQTRNPLLTSFSPRTWQDFFMTLLEVLSKKKAILVFDELQWLARGRTKFVSVFKSYWDGYFLSRNLTVILCGSIAHYMVKKVIKSKSLYGRINCEMLVGELEPPFARKLLGKRGELEGLQYQLILGGVPKYLNEVDQNASFDANIQRLFFSTNSFFGERLKRSFSRSSRRQGYTKKSLLR